MKDVGLWLNLLIPQKPYPKPATNPVAPFRRSLCFCFNKDQCKCPNLCKYKHLCSFCDGSHSTSCCFKRLASGNSHPQKDLFLKSRNAGEVNLHGAMASHLSKLSDGGSAV